MDIFRRLLPCPRWTDLWSWHEVRKMGWYSAGTCSEMLCSMKKKGICTDGINLILASPENCSCVLGSCSPRNCNNGHEGSGPVKFSILYLQAVLFPMVSESRVLWLSGVTGFMDKCIDQLASLWICRIVACCILVVYLSLVYGIYVPDWEFRVRNVDSPNYGKILTVGNSSTLW
jgi:hypothetical protein